MRKVYPGNAFRRPVVAVRNLSLSVPAGECFGFLGINGAGKTTAMSILTGDFPPTGGNAAVKGYDILKEMQKVRQVIGYCPQFDPLLDLMTGREHLILFARLRGVKKRDLNRLVDTLIDQIGLTKFADKVSSSYSGGNKRKLSLGIALIGNPSLVMLDEPSSGMI
jgi:ABC-type multidrug transport system ATPase subunit